MYNRCGQFAKDWEEGVNFERLRKERLQKVRESMQKHGLAAIVACTGENIRYLTGLRGLATPGKIFRYTVLPLEGEPVHFEQGGDLRRVKLNAPWMEGRITFSIPVTDGASEAGDQVRARSLQQWAAGIKKVLNDCGAAHGKIGFDAFDLSMLAPLQDADIDYVDATPTLYRARFVKTRDELQLLKIASTIADAGFHRMQEIIKPGLRECEVWAEVSKTMLSLGAEGALGICSAGGRTNPYYRTEGSDKILAYGDLLVSDIVVCYMGYYTCVVRTLLVGNHPSSEQKALYRQCYDSLYKAINTCKAHVGADVVAENLPPSSMEEFSLNIGHGLGMHYHEPPFIIREYSRDYPIKLEPNMYLAMETYAGEPGGTQGVRLEEDFAITEDGYEMFSLYPFEDRML